MIKAHRYKPTIQHGLIWLVRQTYGRWLQWAYNTSIQGSELFERIKPPFILVGNHATIIDPFLVNTYVPYDINWIASDGNMRNKFMRFVMIKLAGCIPKSKAIPDIETVSWIFEIIKKQGGVVGIYPEGYSSWDGSSNKSFGSTAKLFKTLKVPVVCALSQGAYMTKPRWSHTRRRGKIIISFSELLTSDDLKRLRIEEIDMALNKAIQQDDPVWAQKNGLSYPHKHGAEFLELALYACPSCGALQSLHSSGTHLTCKSCGFTTTYNANGSFSILDKGKSEQPLYLDSSPVDSSLDPLPDTKRQAGSPPSSKFFPSIREWDAWQKAYLAKLIDTVYSHDCTKAIFSDDNVQLLKGKRMDTMRRLGRGSVTISSEGIVFNPRHGEKPRRAGDIQFPIEHIDSPGVLKWNHFEFYNGNTVYRIKFADRRASGRKYAVALNLLLQNQKKAQET